MKQASSITAIGTSNPKYKQLQCTIAQSITSGFNLTKVQKRILNSIYNSTGIEYRYSVLADYNKEPGQFEFFPNNHDDPFPTTAARMQIYKDNALDLALSAISNCLANVVNFSIDQITHLITVSCTGMYAPGLDIEIVQHLKLKSTTKRTAINFMGCYGAFNALKVADSICQATPDASVLIVCLEICTIHFQQNMNMDNIISSAIFADGAACALIQGYSKQKKFFSLSAFHNDLIPQTDKEMAWHIGNNGFDIVLSSYVPDIIKSGIAGFMKNLLHKSTLQIESFDFYAIHPGGLKILQACETALNISTEQNKYSYEVLRSYGNMSSATILFVLKSILENLKPEDNAKNVFSCAFGPGLTFESMILQTHSI